MSVDHVALSGAEFGTSESEERQIREELPEIEMLADPEMQRQVVAVWASFLRDSTYARIADAPAFPGLPAYDLCGHTRQVVRHCDYMAGTLQEFWSLECDREALLAAALTHDSSKLVEREGPNGTKTPLGEALLHAQLAGVRCLEAGLPAKVAHIVTMHPYTPPHVHVKPQCVEFVILSWADIGAADPVFFLEGKPTHLDIDKRFFTLD